MKIKVSDLIVRFLEEQNIKHVFLLSGGMMMHLLDSVSNSKKIRYICNHHEQACAMAADGYYRLTNKMPFLNDSESIEDRSPWLHIW